MVSASGTPSVASIQQRWFATVSRSKEDLVASVCLWMAVRIFSLTLQNYER